MTNTLTPEQKQWHCDGYLLYTLKDSGTYRKGEPVMVNEDMIRVSGDNADAVLARLQALLSPLPSPPELTAPAIEALETLVATSGHPYKDGLAAVIKSALSPLPSPPVSGEAVAWLRDAHNGEGDECLVPCAKGDPGGFPVYASPLTNEPVVWGKVDADTGPNLSDQLAAIDAGPIVPVRNKSIRRFATNEPVGVTIPADLARCLLVENNQHEKHLLQWTEGRATNRLDEYIELLKQSRDRLSAAIGERG